MIESNKQNWVWHNWFSSRITSLTAVCQRKLWTCVSIRCVCVCVRESERERIENTQIHNCCWCLIYIIRIGFLYFFSFSVLAESHRWMIGTCISHYIYKIWNVTILFYMLGSKWTSAQIYPRFLFSFSFSTLEGLWTEPTACVWF